MIGPGTLTFYWKVSSEPGFDTLSVLVNGEEQASISGETAWAQVNLSIPSGDQLVEWVYAKDGSGSSGSDAGWLDKVAYSGSGSGSGGGGGGGGGGGTGITRIAGSNRYETAVEISKKGWSSSDWVIVTTGGNYPDALAGAALAGAYGCPILITPPASLSGVTQSEINRLKAKNCFILGGAGAVSENVRNQILSNTTVSNIIRLGGANRYDTAKLIAERVKLKMGTVTTAIIATGDDFPDALASSPLAGSKKYPILLTQKNSLPAATYNAIKNLGITHSIIVGGTGAISNEVQTRLPSPVRKAGGNRYATAAEISKYGVSLGLSWSTILVSTGMNYPDALTGGAYGAKNKSPLILVNPSDLNNSPDTKNLLLGVKSGIGNTLILGGAGAVSETVKAQLEELID